MDAHNRNTEAIIQSTRKAATENECYCAENTRSGSSRVRPQSLPSSFAWHGSQEKAYAPQPAIAEFHVTRCPIRLPPYSGFTQGLPLKKEKNSPPAFSLPFWKIERSPSCFSETSIVYLMTAQSGLILQNRFYRTEQSSFPMLHPEPDAKPTAYGMSILSAVCSTIQLVPVHQANMETLSRLSKGARPPIPLSASRSGSEKEIHLLLPYLDCFSYSLLAIFPQHEVFHV